ncbi:hypothetical protein B0H15DRAFT_929221 [Mycena belliarum]|uniref:Uncharacterized protein n=1 Tax=Mycena belliarum TaxID=1033014 RepID=A0AAD6XUT3_9AGAR|nr:hypothetical protein B0H15DRAFT_929221 [Mycena belliae]
MDWFLPCLLRHVGKSYKNTAMSIPPCLHRKTKSVFLINHAAVPDEVEELPPCHSRRADALRTTRSRVVESRRKTHRDRSRPQLFIAGLFYIHAASHQDRRRSTKYTYRRGVRQKNGGDECH